MDTHHHYDPTLAAVQRFNSAFNRHDVDAVMDAMTQNCVFENTSPPPDGLRVEGAAAVRAYWEKFFAANPDALFQAEDLFAAGDRCAVRWIYRKTKDGKSITSLPSRNVSLTSTSKSPRLLR